MTFGDVERDEEGSEGEVAGEEFAKGEVNVREEDEAMCGV